MSADLETRLCVVCGMSVPASHDRGQPGPGCLAPDACTFDLTEREAWQHWRQKYHDMVALIAELKAERDAAHAKAASIEELEAKLAKAVAYHAENARILGHVVDEAQGQIAAGKLAALEKCRERSATIKEKNDE